MTQITKIEFKPKELCLLLLRADYEDEVTSALSGAGLLDDDSCWRPLGGVEGNWAIVGNQQSKPVDALVDKLVNSIDAVLMSECRRHSIDPESSIAPSSMEEAVKSLFCIPEGRLANASPDRRQELSDMLFLVATGATKGDPSYTIVDKGEGQTPQRMPATLLSLPSSGKPYKAKIPFVQGVFNMGGTGVLPFCSPKSNYQLIISRRAPHACDPNDPTAHLWGFTLVRRRRPCLSTGRMSRYEYLAPGGIIPTFEALAIPALPGNYPEAYHDGLEFGTVIKLYEYQIRPAALRSPILLDLYYELSRHFVAMAIPVRLCERREGYTMHSYETTLFGMDVRLAIDRSEVLEDGFPESGYLNIPGLGKLPVTVYAFTNKVSSDSKIRNRWNSQMAVGFTINGQVHYQLGPSLFMKKDVNLDYIAHNILVVVDCTPIPIEKREDLVMGSRDRLRLSDDWMAIEEELEQDLKLDEGLRALNEKRKTEEMQKAFGDDKPLEEILGKLLQVSPSLSALFGRGLKLHKPTSFEWRKRMAPYSGKRFPTFFRLRPGFPTELKCAYNGARIVHFETDAENHYFTRPREMGTCIVTPSEAFMAVKLWNGIARLTLFPPPTASPGDRIPVMVTVSDPSRTSPICLTELSLLVDNPHKVTILTPHATERVSQRIRRGRFKRFIEGAEDESGISLPKTYPVEKSNIEWTTHFSEDADAVDVKLTNEQIDLIYVNMSNPYLLSELANRPGEEVALQNQYRIGLALAAVAVYHSLKSTPKQADADSNGVSNADVETLKEDVRKALRGVAMIILPMINTLGATVKAVASEVRSEEP